jgi:membrane dipeptidase
MSRFAALLFALTLPCAAAAPPDPALFHARALLQSTILIDGHNDLPWEIREDLKTPMDVEAYELRQHTRGETDLARIKQGLLRGQFWSIFVPGELKDGYARTPLEQFDLAKRMIARYPDRMELALTAAGVRRIAAQGKLASLLGMEGGHVPDVSVMHWTSAWRR